MFRDNVERQENFFLFSSFPILLHVKSPNSGNGFELRKRENQMNYPKCWVCFMAHAIICIQVNTYRVWEKVISQRVAFENNCVYGRFGLKWRLCIPISPLSVQGILYLFGLCSLNCMVDVDGGQGCEFEGFNKKKSSSSMSHTVCDIKSTHLHV